MSNIEKLKDRIVYLEGVVKDPKYADLKSTNEVALKSLRSKLAKLEAEEAQNNEPTPAPKAEKPKAEEKPPVVEKPKAPGKKAPAKKAPARKTPARKTPVKATPKGKKYKFRAELEIDIEKFEKAIGAKITKSSDKDGDPVGTFYSMKSITTLIKAAYDIEDGHVIGDTINLESEYTGERDGERFAKYHSSASKSSLPVVDWKKPMTLAELKALGEVHLVEYKVTFTGVKLKAPVHAKTIGGEKDFPKDYTVVFLMEDDKYLQMNVHDIPSTPKVLDFEKHSQKAMKEGQVISDDEPTPKPKAAEKPKETEPKTEKPKTKRKKRTPAAATPKGQSFEVAKMDLEEDAEAAIDAIDAALDKVIVNEVTTDKKLQKQIRDAKHEADNLLSVATREADTKAEVKMLADAEKNVVSVVKKIESGDIKPAEVAKAIEEAVKPLKGIKSETKPKAKAKAKTAKKAIEKAEAKRKTASKPTEKTGSNASKPTKRKNASTVHNWLVDLELNGEYKKTIASSDEIVAHVEKYLSGEIDTDELDDLVDVTLRMSKLQRVTSRFKKFGKELPAFIYIFVEGYMQGKTKDRINKIMLLNKKPIVVLEMKPNSGFRSISYIGFDISTGEEVTMSKPSNGSYKVIAVWKESDAKQSKAIALEPIYNTNNNKTRCDALAETAKSAYDCLNGRCTEEEQQIVLELSNMCGDLKGEEDARCFRHSLHQVAGQRYQASNKTKHYGKYFSEVRQEDEAKAKKAGKK